MPSRRAEYHLLDRDLQPECTSRNEHRRTLHLQPTLPQVEHLATRGLKHRYFPHDKRRAGPLQNQGSHVRHTIT
jgi:hypothetical protein